MPPTSESLDPFFESLEQASRHETTTLRSIRICILPVGKRFIIKFCFRRAQHPYHSQLPLQKVLSNGSYASRNVLTGNKWRLLQMDVTLTAIVLHELRASLIAMTRRGIRHSPGASSIFLALLSIDFSPSDRKFPTSLQSHVSKDSLSCSARRLLSLSVISAQPSGR